MSLTLDRAIEVYDPAVDRLRLARYYLESELPNVIHLADPQTAAIIGSSVARLEPAEVWRLLEALSFTYRVNGVFSSVTNEAVDWQEVLLPVDAITMTGVNPRVNDIVYSADIQRDPQKFARFLRSYFAHHRDADDDPRKLNEFRPRSDRSIVHEVLITHESDGEIRMLDGTHRLVALAMGGLATVRCFSAIPNSKPRRSMVGDSTFMLLRHLYARHAQPEAREAILTTAALLAGSSTDGPAAVQSYWIDHPRSSAMKEVGRALLARIARGDGSERR